MADCSTRLRKKRAVLKFVQTLMDWDETIAGQWDELWKSHLVGHTHLQDPWIHPLPLLLLSLPLLCFCSVKQTTSDFDQRKISVVHTLQWL